ncbi:hypothetical protein AR158_c282L [Paramecium bursaria Chlorella virus AR158]|uniref:hypothetical protein n=1 Tax=Paramecium bursaria Chlorella virus AR158 TaxID=380598 RepID=UPI00015AA8E9|nr:hypothetical protein AR158_c282L [Paramecium bursaria Chlorella virus AR158]ABU43827.1 hypothetical protein AR158_c282L [Paramecium bursaria Chlorella virus AR158]
MNFLSSVSTTSMRISLAVCAHSYSFPNAHTGIARGFRSPFRAIDCFSLFVSIFSANGVISSAYRN